MKGKYFLPLLLLLTGCSLLHKYPIQKPGETPDHVIIIGANSNVQCSYCTVIGSNLKLTTKQCSVIDGPIDDSTKKTFLDPRATYGLFITRMHETEVHCGFREGKLDTILRHRFLSK